MNDTRRQALERGLAEFDRTFAKRRARRGAVAVASVVVGVAAITAMAWREQGGSASAAREAMASRPLPSYVEFITDDAQLTIELELAMACERIGRREGRVYVVECAR